MARRDVRINTFPAPADNPMLDANREISLYRPCFCGCDNREGSPGVGYITASGGGEGVTIFIDNEEDYQAIRKVFEAQGLTYQP
jgi:hypothetical protein